MIRRLEQLSELELKRIAGKNSGKDTLIIVHPLRGYSYPQFEKFIEKKDFEKRLTLIFEHYPSAQKIQDFLRKKGARKSDSLLIVHTKGPSSDPVMGWQKLIAKLERLGVKNITVDGRHQAAYDLHRLRTEIGEEKTNRKNGQRRIDKRIYGFMRTANRAATVAKSKIAWQYCAGFAWSKLAASGKFRKVRLSKRFL